MSNKRSPQAKCFVFTLNNYTSEEVDILKAGHCSIEYMVFGFEVAPETGTPHLQGYLRMLKQVRYGQIHKILCKRMSLQVAKYGVKTNFDYCSKEDGGYYEFGIRPLEGQDKASNSKKLSREEKAIIVHETLEEFKDAESVFKVLAGEYYYNGRALISNWLAMKKPIDRPGINVWWLYGPPGIGKSKLAHSLLPKAYIKCPKIKWWNGYMLEPDVIMDDFGSNCVDINHLLRWFDRYKYQVEYKGGMIPLHAVNVIITSNYSPNDLFKEPGQTSQGICELSPHSQLPALLRRIRLCPFGGKYPETIISCAEEAIYRATPEEFTERYISIVKDLQPRHSPCVSPCISPRSRSLDRLPRDLLDD